MWQSAYINANGIRLHYTRTGGTGGDKPALVLLHGFSDDGLCWTPTAEALSNDFDIIMLDARGHGRSDGPMEGYGHAEHAADVAGVVAGLGLRKPVVMGHSMGSVTTLAVAGLYPELPGAIVLEDPPPFWSRGSIGLQTDRRHNMHQWIIDLKRKTREEMLDGLRESNPTWPEAEHGPWADSKLRLSMNVLNGFGGVGMDLHDAVQHITCPALLLTADTSLGAIATEANAAELKSLMPQLQVVNVPNAGHNIRREQFGPYMDAVRGFLHSVTL